ncbi:site-specific integrase [Robertkochia sediminum]|uniref:site-specific integrase n=1 Tax=Robertkochia sediminum TaxID=2785326 RepID=UPI001931E297|nr:site-specific integrase [Robertkochia sediminum]MBL7472908.1 site-specific integrase [Robertkochia sediminum]
MASVRAVLKKKMNSRGLYPITIRITKNGQTSYVFTGQYIAPRFWDKDRGLVRSGHPNATRLNHFIVKKLAAVNDKLLEAEINGEHISAKGVRKRVKGEDRLDFFDMANIHLDNLKRAEKYRQYQTQKARVEKFRKFLGPGNIPFDEITVNVLKKFEGFILNQEKRKPRTAVNYLIMIRKIYNMAIAEGVASRAKYPFGRGKITIKIPESQKIGLSISEVVKLESAEDLTEAQLRALHVWLISFYFAGIRVSDVLELRWSDFNDGRLLYRMNKNQKLVSLKVPEKAEQILAIYRKDAILKNDLVFDYLKGTNFDDKLQVLTRIRTATRTINRRLQLIADKLGIDKKLSMHIARHTFGNISGDKISIQMLQKLYRHSSITTTITYQASFMQREADDALDKVVNF